MNEVLAGRAGSVEVVLTPDGGVRVADDGPGIPVEAGDAAGGGPGLEALLTRPHAGADPGGRHAVPMSMFGIGLCVANALSSRVTAEVRRAGSVGSRSTCAVSHSPRPSLRARLPEPGPPSRSGPTPASSVRRRSARMPCWRSTSGNWPS
ncbi:hypothetical protein AB0O22_38115 [Streptomyces sp. NPDC091204]|uniref:hypothetical protein n=1 Tax=Streptomyces sp. NPDC091204 TaxID=3155299 RepID=UPI00341DF3A9